MALTKDLLMSGVDFLLGNELAGGRVWMQLPFTDAVSGVEAAESAASEASTPASGVCGICDSSGRLQ